MAQNKNNVRMSDIAKRLNISTVAVSKALNNQKGVSEDLRARVKALAEEMGYHSPAQIRRMQGKAGYNIGVLIPTQYVGGSSESFYWKLYQEVTARAMKKDCFVLLELLSNEDAQARRLPKLITENKADGLIIIGKPPFNYAKHLKDSWDKPILYLDFYDADIAADSVLSNSFYGTFLLTQHLIEMGHKDIGFVGTLLATDSINDRYLGYVKAMVEHKLPIHPQWILPDRHEKTGETLPIPLPEKMPTAFVCNCDLTAGFMIHQLEKKGFRVPMDVSVVGFDNYLATGMLSIGLTTYAVDLAEMAHLAVRGILRRINGESWQQGMHITDGVLTLRDSVRNLNRP